MRNASIVTLYKNKGDEGDCSKYRGISLLSIVGKLFARVELKRLQVLAGRVYPESQRGFRKGRSTIGMIFFVRRLQKRREQQQPLFIAFIDQTSGSQPGAKKGQPGAKDGTLSGGPQVGWK